MQASTALAVRAPATALIETLIVNDENALEQLKAALPANVTATRFIAALKTALIDDAIEQRDESKRLLTANPASLFQAVVKCAQDGLLPDRREAALVRYGDKVQYLPMMYGERKIAAEFGWTIRTHVVYANDRFEVLEGTEQRIEHRPAAPGSDRGEVLAAYAVAHHRDARTSIVEVMTLEDIERARAVSKMPNGPAWKGWYGRMAEKTVGHRIAKKLPLDPQDAQRLMRVIEASELEPGQSTEILYGTSGSSAEGEAARTTPPSTDGQGGTIQQAGDASAAGPSPAPGSDQEEDFGGVEFGEPVGEPDTDPDIAAAQAASTYVVEAVRDDVWVKGLTLAQINARGEEGEQFFRWALNPAKNAGAELRAQADAYAKVQLPALWAEFARVS